MRAPISVVIPTLNAQSALETTLGPVYEGVQAGLLHELILSDGGSTDDTAKIADAAGAVWVTGSPSRGGQIARGIAAAQADWVLILHADTILPKGWAGMCHSHMTRGQAGYFDLRFDHRGVMARIVARWVWFRSRKLGLPYGDQALFVSREMLQDIGGYPDLPLMEDVTIAKRLTGKLVPLGGYVVTSAEKYRKRGWLTQGARNLRLLVKFLRGADPQQLYDDYYTPPKG